MTLFAIGGGGFDSDNPMPRLDSAFLGMAGKARPKICLIPTASGDSALRIGRFLRSCSTQDCQPSVLELFHLTTTDIPGFLAEQDLVFVSGGNTRNLLVLWREWGLDVALKEAINGGLIVGGVSAGANCWFESFSTDSNPGGLSAWQGLGWLNGSFCPHYDEEVDRKPSLTAMMARGEIGAGYAADGGAGILFRNGVVEGVISARQGAKGYRVSWTPESGLCEDPLPVLAHLPS